jgi:hypothetical protein
MDQYAYVTTSPIYVTVGGKRALKVIIFCGMDWTDDRYGKYRTGIGGRKALVMGRLKARNLWGLGSVLAGKSGPLCSGMNDRRAI